MIRVFEAFSGVRMQKMALDMITRDFGIKFEFVGYSEIDKHAIASSIKIHGNDCENYGDISAIKGCDLPLIDLFTYSFPCQDVSTAGNRKGIEEGTRSGLLLEVKRILQELKEINRLPVNLFMENVTGLLSKNFVDGFLDFREFLGSLGYENSMHVMNANKYGIPQSRDRVFMISDLNGVYYNRPKEQELKLFLKDVLCDFDEKYFLKQELVDRFRYLGKSSCAGTTREENKKGHEAPRVYLDVSGTVTATDWKRPHQVLLKEGYLLKDTQANRVYKDNCSQTICANGGGGGAKTGLYLIKENTSKGFVETKKIDGIILDNPNSKTKRGRIQDSQAPTIMTSGQVGVITHGKYEGMAIKKLSPRECWRLMGMPDEYYFKAAEVSSATQLYKQAGNGIVLNCMYELFRKMYVDNSNEELQQTLF